MTILVLGATGLVGSECLKLFANDPSFQRVTVLTRGSFYAISPNIVPYQVDFDKPDSFKSHLKCDAVVCTLGSTAAKSPNYSDYRKIDLEIPVMIGRMALDQGAQQFILVTAAGAKVGSVNSYLAMKGDVEAAIKSLVYPCTAFIRPSLILGPRGEFRLKEYLSQKILGPIRFMFPKRIRPVTAQAIAQSIVMSLKSPKPGVTVVSNAEIASLR